MCINNNCNLLLPSLSSNCMQVSMYIAYTVYQSNHWCSTHWPAASVLRSLPPAVPTSTAMVYSVVGSRSSITTLESLVLTVLTVHTTLPTCRDGWYVRKYTGNPLAWWRVSGVQLTRAALLLFTLSTFTLLTWAVGAEWADDGGEQIIETTPHESKYNSDIIMKCTAAERGKSILLVYKE